jgi:hypothetical protein
MAVRLLPLTLPELCAHALLLERSAAEDLRAWAQRLRQLDEPRLARELEQMEREEQDEVRALRAASGDVRMPELSPWEYAWRLTYLPDALERRPRLVPMNAREALHLVQAARRRARSFYEDVAANARAPVVRAFAAEMAANVEAHLLRIDVLLEDAQRAEALRRSGGRGVAPTAG